MREKKAEKKVKLRDKISQDHVHDMLFSEELGWQAILFDLINTEQLDPWDIDLILLSNKYLEKIKELEEANFFVSSKVLLATSLLLRIKSEILLNKHIKTIDEILFGKEEEKKYKFERIELEEGEIPMIVPKTPLPRFRQVTLQELMSALNKAMETETRRIKRELTEKHALRQIDIVLPKKRINIRDKIREINQKLKVIFKSKDKISFSEIAGKKRDQRIATFVPLLHLDNQKKVWLEQHGHFEEIWIFLKKMLEKQEMQKGEGRDEIKNKLRGTIRETKKQIDKENELRRELDEEFENPLRDFFEKF